MEILIPVLIAVGVSVLVGAGLSIADVFFAVKKDEKEEAVREALPGANCGACGFSGCDGYACALTKGEITNCSLCNPGGQQTAQAIAEILGLEADNIVRTVAKVRCVGFCDKTDDKMVYNGAKSCKTAKQLHGGKGKCSYGCIGFGDCADVCENDAITVCNGVAVVNTDGCFACGKCVKVCPNSLIELVPAEKGVKTVFCSNKDKGAQTKKVCSAGCIGCKKCEKACEYDAIKVKDSLAKIDSEKCNGCGKCAEACPQKVIN